MSNSSNCSPCGGSSTVQQQIVLPVSANECPQTCSTGNGIEGCQAYFQPWDVTANAAVTIPAVGGTFVLTVCDANKFPVGMWIQGTALGRYPIVAHSVSQGTVTLQNGCSNGTAINGNPAPGTVVTGQQLVWVIGSAECIDADTFQDEVFDALAEMNSENLLCLPDVAESLPTEPLFLFGLTAACDSGDCPPGPDPNCLKKNPFITFQEGTICFIGGLTPAADGETVRSVGVTTDGCLRQTSGGSFVSLRVQILKKNGAGNAAAISAAINDSVDLASYGVPTGAVAALIRVYYGFQSDPTPGEGLYFSTYIRGAGEGVHSSAAYIMETYLGLDISTEDNIPFGSSAVVPLTPSNKTIYHEWENIGTAGSGNTFGMVLLLDGYYI